MGFLDRNGFIHRERDAAGRWQGLCHQAGQEASRRASLFESISLQTVNQVIFESRGLVIGSIGS
jgi:hypothetical protein